MVLNFGHTFAHAIEVKNQYTKKVSHGEAVLCGMILASRLSFFKKVCNYACVSDIENIYKNNNLSYTYKKYLNIGSLNSLIPLFKNDKKNNDEKINFILLKKIGSAAKPGAFKVSQSKLKKYFKVISQY